MLNLEVTSGYYTAAKDKLFFESPYIVDGHKKLYGEESVFNLVKTLVDEKAAAPIFKEFIQEKNGVVLEVECLRTEYFLGAVSELKSKPVLNQLLNEYIDKETASAAPEHA